ncbi:hypothetical protein D8771_29940 [Streptomyces albus]|uniref:HTH iclR-type domain-containing protein n=2 Tax=Streptomyces TaxID=1883 RepID=A0A8H1L369_9ACTN|nr:hypothetical protein D8771_29940 [Streptomyces albus]
MPGRESGRTGGQDARNHSTLKVWTYGEMDGAQDGAGLVSAARGFALLAALAALEREQPGAHRLGVIAGRAGLSPSQANKLLAQAEEHGLVRRTGYGRYTLTAPATVSGKPAPPLPPSASPRGTPPRAARVPAPAVARRPPAPPVPPAGARVTASPAP